MQDIRKALFMTFLTYLYLEVENMYRVSIEFWYKFASVLSRVPFSDWLRCSKKLSNYSVLDSE